MVGSTHRNVLASINYALAQQRAGQSSQNKVITQLENSLYKRALTELNLVVYFWIFQAIYTFVLDSSPSVRRTVEFQSQKKGASQSSNGGVIPTLWCRPGGRSVFDNYIG